jgi:hypothetical protein
MSERVDMTVYHFTDTARLPWILHSGVLRAGQNRIGGYPADFLWAITDSRDATSASVGRKGYRKGVVRLVRFTLPAEDFEPWREIVRRMPDWTPKHIEALERTGNCSPRKWVCRVDPLPRSRWIEIATRSYTDDRWRPFPKDYIPLEGRGHFLGVVIEGRGYASRQYDRGAGRGVGCEVITFDPAKPTV